MSEIQSDLQAAVAVTVVLFARGGIDPGRAGFLILEPLVGQ